MSNVLVMHENYLNSDTYASMSYSTQQSAMPATNVLDGTRRSRVWRTNGQWEITSSNNGLVVSKGSGDQNATVAVANYTSDATFFAAIKAAIEAVLAGVTITVSRDASSNKIKLAASGTATFELRNTNLAATLAPVIGFPANNTGALTYTAANLKIHTSEWMKFDLGSAFNPKAFIIMGLRNTALKISETATVRLQGNQTDVWTSPAYNQTLSYSEFAMGVFSSTGLHTEALRYWRVYIEDPANVNTYVEISNMYLGDAIVPSQGAVRFPLRTRLVDLGERSTARSGLSLTNKIQLTEEIQLSWANLTKSEKEALEDFTRDVGLSKPFFLCLDPGEYFSDDLERHIRYVKFTDGPEFYLVAPNNFASDWSVREEL